MDRNGALDLQETLPLLDHFIQRYEECQNVKIEGTERREMEERLFAEMDGDQSGTIDFHELKVFLTRKYDVMFRKAPVKA